MVAAPTTRRKRLGLRLGEFTVENRNTGKTGRVAQFQSNPSIDVVVSLA